MKWPNCSTMGPQWPDAASDIAPYPSHFYRIQFKRVDGDGIRTHWREWYPWMANLAVQYKDKAAAAKSGRTISLLVKLRTIGHAGTSGLACSVSG